MFYWFLLKKVYSNLMILSECSFSKDGSQHHMAHQKKYKISTYNPAPLQSVNYCILHIEHVFSPWKESVFIACNFP